MTVSLAAGFDAGLSAFLDGDYRRAREIWRPLAENGDAQSQFGLAMMLERGHGTPADPEKASEWYLRAAEQGMAEAQLSLGSLYQHGRGVARDFERAAELYRSAAEQGNAQAQYNLAMLYLGGEGVAPDRNLGIAWLRRAAAQRYGRAARHLEMMGVALRAPAVGQPSDPLGADPASDDLARAPATAAPRTDMPDFMARRQEPESDGAERLNILTENNQFEVPLAATEEAVINETAIKETDSEEIEPEGERAEGESAGGADFAVLLATFDRKDAAGAAWNKMKARYPALFRDLRPRLTALELGGGDTVLWRLEAEPLASEREAVALCEALRRKGDYCFPVRVDVGLEN